MEVSAGELCGFGTGTFDEAIVRASNSSEPNLFPVFFLVTWLVFSRHLPLSGTSWFSRRRP